ncbi:MAG: HAD-IB family phosphatase [Leptospiraceae bacterium]|nr:HAD-IB family phosphatase [Leptospiraceae bacterium]MDW7975779.1 HAD-IB family phosphatase [Leptospiraceae bacterium]
MILRKWNPQIQEILIKLKEHKQNSLAVFDFDHTLIYGDQGFNLMNYLIENLYIKADEEWFWDEKHWYNVPGEKIRKIKDLFFSLKKNPTKEHIKALLTEIFQVYDQIENQNQEIAYRWTKIFFAGYKEEELEKHSVQSFEQAMRVYSKNDPSNQETQIAIHTALHDLIQYLNSSGWEIYIITASPEVAIRAIIHHWGLKKSQVLGMKLQIKKNYLQPEIIEPYPYGKGKWERLRQVTHKPIILAVGDSRSDFDLLENAEYPVFINRNQNSNVLKEAEKKGFFIQSLVNE